ncbi:MAG: amidohydrolase family protein [Bacteroidota bacterium]
MEKRILRTGRILTMDRERRVVEGGGIVLEGPVIREVLGPGEAARWAGPATDLGGRTALPGFIHTHVHLCQTLFRGLADDLDLLDWLQQRILPFEAAHSAASIRASALVGLAELIRSGATTLMDMGTIRHEEEIVRAVTESGIRAMVGKALMDLNDLYPALKETTSAALSSARAEAEAWHGSAGGRVGYAVAPRFVLSSTEELLRGAYEITRSHPGSLFHTHASENLREVEAVRRRCSMENIEYLDAIGVLGDNTCLAHCVHVGEGELDLLAKRRAGVLHCPSANLKLGSGVAPVPRMMQKGIKVSLGADGAPCNNTLNMFTEMRLAALIQKPLCGPRSMDAWTVLETATRGGARCLGMEERIGSIEPGKRADILFLDLEKVWNPLAPATGAEVASAIVYCCSSGNVRDVMADGEWLLRDGELCTIEEEGVRPRAREELKALLGRVRT